MQWSILFISVPRRQRQADFFEFRTSPVDIASGYRQTNKQKYILFTSQGYKKISKTSILHLYFLHFRALKKARTWLLSPDLYVRGVSGCTEKLDSDLG